MNLNIIDWNDELPAELEAFYDANQSTAHKRELPDYDTTIYWLYTTYENQKVTISWADDFMGRIVVWAYGELSGKKLEKDFLLGA